MKRARERGSAQPIDQAEALLLVAGADPSRWRLVQERAGSEVTCAFAVDLRAVLDLLTREKRAILVLASDLLDASISECLLRIDEELGRTQRVVVVDQDSPCAAGKQSSGSAIWISEAALSRDLVPTIRALVASTSGRPAPDHRVDRDVRGSATELDEFPAYRRMVLGSSPGIRKAADMVRKVAPVDVTVLLLGETGTGKELFARRIHCMSERARGPFRSVSLPAVPNDLFESILFGHERGAFTGAVSRSSGAFEQAREGTLFFDEVSSLGLHSQPKLLRAIQEKEIERVGSRAPSPCDVRIVAATNQDLREMVSRQEFREDLFHRLSVVTIEIPPLRHRREDIPLLVRFFIDRYANEFRREVPEVSRAAMRALEQHEWTGNVRELENLTQRALLFKSGEGPLQPADFFEEPRCTCGSPIHFQHCELSLAEVEQAYIREVVARSEGNQSRAAEILDIDRKTLRAKLRKPTRRAQPKPRGTLRAVSG